MEVSRNGSQLINIPKSHHVQYLFIPVICTYPYHSHFISLEALEPTVGIEMQNGVVVMGWIWVPRGRPTLISEIKITWNMPEVLRLQSGQSISRRVLSKLSLLLPNAQSFLPLTSYISRTVQAQWYQGKTKMAAERKPSVSTASVWWSSY